MSLLTFQVVLNSVADPGPHHRYCTVSVNFKNNDNEYKMTFALNKKNNVKKNSCENMNQHIPDSNPTGS